MGKFDGIWREHIDKGIAKNNLIIAKNNKLLS